MVVIGQKLVCNFFLFEMWFRQSWVKNKNAYVSVMTTQSKFLHIPYNQLCCRRGQEINFGVLSGSLFSVFKKNVFLGTTPSLCLYVIFLPV